MLRISDATIEKIADDIVGLIRQGKLLKTAVGGGLQSKEDEQNILKRKRDNLTIPLEIDFRKDIIPLFNKQRDKVIYTLQGKKAIDPDIKKAINVPTSKEETVKFVEYMLPKITAIMAIAGNEALAELEIGIAFDVLEPEVVNWLELHCAEAVKNIGKTTKQMLKRTLIEGIENGESIAKLTKRIQEVYKPLELEEWRAKRIAMTETKDAFSQGNLQGYKQSGLKGKKGILLAPTACDICIGLERIGLIDLDDTWEGYECPTFHPNCHCDIYFTPE